MKLRRPKENLPLSIKDTVQEIELCDRCDGHGKVIRSAIQITGRATVFDGPREERCEQCRGAGRVIRTTTLSYIDGTEP